MISSTSRLKVSFQILHLVSLPTLSFLGEPFNDCVILDDYIIDKLLGEGGFGKVHLGINRENHKQVAIKFMDIRSQRKWSRKRECFICFLVQNAEEVQGLYNEAQNLKMLKHRNIVELYHVFREGTTLIMIMEFACGGMLLDFLQDHYPLGEVKARNIFLQIVSAIHYCHLKGVVHRDLKLENVLFKDEYRDNIKLIDFGIAGVCKKGQEDVQESGTMEYQPPEVFEQGKVTSSPSQDVWAIGIMFYTMIYGTLPFRGKTDKELRDKIKEAKLVFPKGVPITQDAKDIIRSMLNPDPA